MPNYRERLETVEAVQFHHPRNPPPMVKFDGEELPDGHEDRKAYVLSANKNRIYIKVGEFIITDPKGGFRVMGEDEFNAKFEEY